MKHPIAVTALAGMVALGGATQLPCAYDNGETRRMIGRTSLQLVVVLDPASFVRAWDAPNRKEIPNVPAVDSLHREGEFGMGVVFSDCQAGVDGKCALFATYSILTANGQELVAMPNLPIWRDAPPPQGRAELGKGLWRTSSEASDPLGDYLYRVVVVDRVSGRSVTLERRLQLVE